MSNTTAGGKKVAETNLAKDPDYYKKLGALGGSTVTKNTKLKGFGTNRELAKEAGRIGGQRSKRKRASDYL